MLRYSYLADTITYPTVPISNEYTGDATTPGLGASSLSISITGKTIVAQTSSLSDQELYRGDSTVTVTLSKPQSSIPLSLRRKSEPVAKVHGHTMLRLASPQRNALLVHNATPC